MKKKDINEGLVIFFGDVIQACPRFDLVNSFFARGIDTIKVHNHVM